MRIGRPSSSWAWTFADLASLAHRSVFSRSEITSMTRGTVASMVTSRTTGLLTSLHYPTRVPTTRDGHRPGARRRHHRAAGPPGGGRDDLPVGGRAPPRPGRVARPD